VADRLDAREILAVADRTVEQEIDALQSVRRAVGEPFVNCACRLIACTGLVWVTGVGTSASVGARFAHILSCCGLRSVFLSPADGLHGHSTVLGPQDLLVALSRGGESGEVNQMVRIADLRGTTTIALLAKTGSTLARLAQYTVPVPSPDEYELLGALATTSTVVFSAVCDALCAVVARARGMTAEALRDVHPGGAVGKNLAG
jgi:arabinose-5-phosphate isomerase